MHKLFWHQIRHWRSESRDELIWRARPDLLATPVISPIDRLGAIIVFSPSSILQRLVPGGCSVDPRPERPLSATEEAPCGLCPKRAL